MANAEQANFYFKRIIQNWLKYRIHIDFINLYAMFKLEYC